MAILDRRKDRFVDDQDQRVSVGIEFPFGRVGGGDGYFKSTKTTIESIKNNIKLSNSENEMDDITKSAIIANADDFIKSFEKKYETNVGDGGGKLSGGQKQRISIARAVFRNPPIMILDEATSSLDSESEKLVQKALEKLMKNRTSLVIAHRLSTIQKADLILVIDSGQIIERGNHDELINKNGTYSKLIKLQSFS